MTSAVRHAVAVGLRCVIGVASLLSCTRSDPAKAASSSAARDGAPVAVGLPRPTFTFTDTRGAPYDFSARTAGRLTFLFFGYTHCPDVCPVHAANLAAALRTLTYADRARIDVVFVTVDPERDSAAALRKWLDAFDPSFVGLRAAAPRVDSLLATLGLGGAIRSAPSTSGEYDVGHPSPVIVFAPDDTARAMYPFGTRQAEWARIIPELLARPPRAGARGIRVEQAFLVRPVGDAQAAIYLDVVNDGESPDYLLGMSADIARSVTLYEQQRSGQGMGSMRMAAVDSFPVPPHAALRLTAGGAHAMAEGLQRAPISGAKVELTLRLSRAGIIRTAARIIDYADIDTTVLRTKRS